MLDVFSYYISEQKMIPYAYFTKKLWFLETNNLVLIYPSVMSDLIDTDSEEFIFKFGDSILDELIDSPKELSDTSFDEMEFIDDVQNIMFAAKVHPLSAKDLCVECGVPPHKNMRRFWVKCYVCETHWCNSCFKNTQKNNSNFSPQFGHTSCAMCGRSYEHAHLKIPWWQCADCKNWRCSPCVRGCRKRKHRFPGPCKCGEKKNLVAHWVHECTTGKFT